MRPLSLALLLATTAFAQTRPVTNDEVDKITKSAILIDTHNDVTSRTVSGFDIGEPTAEGHTDIPRLRQGGVGAVFFAIFVGANYTDGNHSANRALQMIDTVKHDIVARHPKDFQFALTADDIEKAHRNGKIAALMGIEGGHAIEDSPRLLRDFYDLGIRYMTLTHSNTNTWADSSGDMDKSSVEHHNGLTPLGKQIVQEMNRLGMIVDISHVADKTFWDALEISKAPLFASHSSCRALADVPRNMTDEMIVALAKKGGVVQINFNCGFLSQASADAEKKTGGGAMARYLELQEKFKNDPEKLRTEVAKLTEEMKATMVRATLADVVAHIDHVRKIAGIDAVGIGSDFDGVTCTPTGLDDVSKFPNLTRALLAKGYTSADILKIYGGNTLRLMRAVQAARQAQPLEAAVHALIDGFDGAVSLYAKNLDTGASIGIRETNPVRTASTIKLAIMASVFDAVARGQAKWSELLTVTAAEKVSGSGIVASEISDGVQLPIADVLHLMIVLSDNTATNMILERFTAEAVNAYLDKLGIATTRSLRKIIRGDVAAGYSTAGKLPENKKYGLGVSTPRDMVAILEKLEKGELVNPEASQQMLAVLKRCQDGSGIRRHLDGTPVANKTGALDALRSDVGIVYSKGGRIAMAITVDGMPKTDYTLDNAGLLLIADLAKMLVEGLAKT